MDPEACSSSLLTEHLTRDRVVDLSQLADSCCLFCRGGPDFSRERG
jgi:hypothetical protein